MSMPARDQHNFVRPILNIHTNHEDNVPYISPLERNPTTFAASTLESSEKRKMLASARHFAASEGRTLLYTLPLLKSSYRPQ